MCYYFDLSDTGQNAATQSINLQIKWEQYGWAVASPPCHPLCMLWIPKISLPRHHHAACWVRESQGSVGFDQKAGTASILCYNSDSSTAWWVKTHMHHCVPKFPLSLPPLGFPGRCSCMVLCIQVLLDLHVWCIPWDAKSAGSSADTSPLSTQTPHTISRLDLSCSWLGSRKEELFLTQQLTPKWAL